MPDLPAPTASRLRPPGWRDRRLLVGIVLVLASVALGVTVTGRADSTEPVYAASAALLPGQPLRAGDLHVVRVRLGAEAGRYLSAAGPPAPGAVVVRSVLPGELVPVSAVGRESAVGTRLVAVPVAAAAVDGLRPGALVDVWVAARGAQPQTFELPRAVVRAAEVVAVSRPGGVLSTSAEASVRLLLAEALVPEVLSAVDNGARVTVVPVPGSVPEGGS